MGLIFDKLTFALYLLRILREREKIDKCAPAYGYICIYGYNIQSQRCCLKLPSRLWFWSVIKLAPNHSDQMCFTTCICTLLIVLPDIWTSVVYRKAQKVTFSSLIEWVPGERETLDSIHNSYSPRWKFMIGHEILNN